MRGLKGKRKSLTITLKKDSGRKGSKGKGKWCWENKQNKDRTNIRTNPSLNNKFLTETSYKIRTPSNNRLRSSTKSILTSSTKISLDQSKMLRKSKRPFPPTLNYFRKFRKSLTPALCLSRLPHQTKPNKKPSPKNPTQTSKKVSHLHKKPTFWPQMCIRWESPLKRGEFRRCWWKKIRPIMNKNNKYLTKIK